jgi:uncharacterized protein YndB with AHSA1/START domain
MDISGRYRFEAPPARVWVLLMDPSAIASFVRRTNGVGFRVEPFG